MPDLTLEELKKNKTLQKLDQANAKMTVKALTQEDELRLMGEQDTRQKAQDSYTNITASLMPVLEYKLRAPAQQPKYNYSRDLEIVAKHKKKKSTQQAEATRRAEKEKIMPLTDQGEALQWVVDEHVDHMLTEPMDTTIDTRITSGSAQLSMLHLTGKEFVPDPKTGMIDAPKLLNLWRRLKNEHNQLKLIRSAKEACNSENLAVMQANSEVFAVLDEAVHAYFKANGIDCDTGEAVRPGEVQSARKKLALAMENYREVAEKYSGILSGYYLPQFKKNYAEEYKKQKEQIQPQDGALTTDRKLNEMRDRVRQWIASNPDAYAANKSKVDKIYQEMFSYMTKTERLRSERIALSLTFRNVKEDGKEEHPVRKEVCEAARREYKRKEGLLKSHISQLEDSLRFMLTGVGPENYGSMLYIEKNYDMVTPGLEDKRYMDQLMQQWPQQEAASMNFQLQKVPTGTDERTREIAYGAKVYNERDINLRKNINQLYDSLRIQAIQMMVRNARDLRKDPDNAVAKHRLKTLETVFGSPNVKLLYETLCSLQDNIQLMRAQVNEVMERKIDGVDGAEHQIPDEAIYRDMPMHLMPLGHAHEMDKDLLVQECNQFSVLQRGVHLNGAASTDQEQQDAVAHEMQVQRQAMDEMRRFMLGGENVLLFGVRENQQPSAILTQRAIIDYSNIFLVREKASTLVARSDLLRKHPKFAGLSEQERNDAKEYAVFFLACVMYTNAIQRKLDERLGRIRVGVQYDCFEAMKNIQDFLDDARAQIQ